VDLLGLERLRSGAAAPRPLIGRGPAGPAGARRPADGLDDPARCLCRHRTPGALNSAFGSTFGQRHFYPALAGKPMRILGDVDAPRTYVYVEDFARGLITLASNEEAFGE
jgi:hypothetical protein